MRGPWMPTSMPTTRPSRSTFGRWTSGERVEMLDRTCWARSLTLRCAPWPWRARSPWWGAAPTAGRGASSDGSPNRVARGEGQSRTDPVGLEDTDNDSVLMLRQMYLTSLAYKLTVPQVGSSFLEHPMDPMQCSKSPSAARCSSIWVTRAYIQWASALHHSLIKFDECRLGQVVVKSTTLSTDLPLHHWHDLRCNHGAHPRGEKLNSSDLSRYPEQMMQGLAAAILCRAGPVLEALRPGGTAPQANPTAAGNFSSTPGDNKRQSRRLKAGQQALAGLGLGQSGGPDIDTEDWRDGRTWGGTLSPDPWAHHGMEFNQWADELKHRPFAKGPQAGTLRGVRFSPASPEWRCI